MGDKNLLTDVDSRTLKKVAWGGDIYVYIQINMDIATTTKNRPRGRFFENTDEDNANEYYSNIFVNYEE